MATFTAEFAATPEAFDAQAQQSYKAYLASTLGVSAEDISLEIRAASVLVIATIRAASEQAAQTAAASLATINATAVNTALAAASPSADSPLTVVESSLRAAVDVAVLPAPSPPPASPPPSSPPSAVGGSEALQGASADGASVVVIAAGAGGAALVLVVLLLLLRGRGAKASRSSRKDVPVTVDAISTTIASVSGSDGSVEKELGELRRSFQEKREWSERSSPEGGAAVGRTSPVREPIVYM